MSLQEHQTIKDSHPWGVVLLAIGSFIACVLGGVGAFTLGWSTISDALGDWGPRALLILIVLVGEAAALGLLFPRTHRGRS